MPGSDDHIWLPQQAQFEAMQYPDGMPEPAEHAHTRAVRVRREALAREANDAAAEAERLRREAMRVRNEIRQTLRRIAELEDEVKRLDDRAAKADDMAARIREAAKHVSPENLENNDHELE